MPYARPDEHVNIGVPNHYATVMDQNGEALGLRVTIANVGAIGVPPAVINAVIDALSGLGVTDMEMPATPERVYRAIQAATSTSQRSQA
mgnify:CR=1 FL=1